MELSAMFVDKIILRTPSSTGRKIDCCSSVLTNECKMYIFHATSLFLQLKCVLNTEQEFRTSHRLSYISINSVR